MFMKIYEYNEPKYFIVTGVIGCIISGVAFPTFAVQFAKAIGFLTIPFEYIPFVYEVEIG